MVALHGGGLDRGVRGLEVWPNLWAGAGLVRSGAGTALVGSHEEVADRIEEFILSGHPHLEEAHWSVEACGRGSPGAVCSASAVAHCARWRRAAELITAGQA